MNSVPKHILAASIVVVEKDHVLLIKSPKRGWEIPGGQVEVGERVTDAAIREAKEESGLDVELTQYCGVYQNVEKGICNMLFLGKAVGGAFTTSTESLEVGFFPIHEALQMISWSNYRERVQMCLDETTHPFFIEF